MADDIIGSLGIQIEADASDLPGQYDAAVSASENAAERIASAFESVVGIGEALAITEGLKEFGQEALTAYGTVQSVTIGLTQLTKSASEANEIIEQIKNVAATEPFAFPDLAPTVQKMVALGVSVEQIPKVLQAAADAAAATGNSFDAVAGSIDRMSLSGTVSARSLVQLGVSTEDLGKVMGVTAGEVKTAFAALDQSERIDVLTQALAKFAGAAEAQAQGIAGQWQIFQNKFEEVMVGVGQAIAPAAGALLNFASDVLHTTQVVVDAFNELPEPIKEVAGALALAVAAIVPLTAAAGTLGLGIVGVRAAIEPLNEVLVALGLRSEEAAVAQEAQAASAKTLAVAEGEAAVASEEAGVAAGAAAEGGITALGLAGSAAAGGLAALVGFKLGEWAYNQIPGVKQLADDLNTTAMVIIPGYQAALEKLTKGHFFTGQDEEGLSEAIIHLQDQLRSLNVTVDQGTMTDEKYYDALVQARNAHKDLDDSVSGTEAALDALEKKSDELQASVSRASAILALAREEYNAGEISLTTLQAAVKAYDDAVKKAAEGNKDYQSTLAGLTEAYSKQADIIATLQNTKDQLLAIEGRSVEQDAILVEVENKLAAAYKAHGDALANLPKAYDGLVTSADQFAKKERDVGDAVGYAKSVLDQAIATNDGSAASQRVVTDALNQYVDKLKASGAAMTDQITINVHGVDVITTLGNAIETIKKSQGDWNTVTVNGVQVLKDHTTAATNAVPAVNALSASHAQLAVDVSKALNYFSPLANGINEVASAASQALNYTDPLAASEKNLGAAADGSVGYQSNLANAITKVGDAAKSTTGALKGVGDSFATTVGDTEAAGKAFQATTAAVDGLSTALQFLAIYAAPAMAALSGTGSAHDTVNSHFVSALDQVSQLQQQQAQAQTGGAALQQQLQQEINTWFDAQQKQATALAANTTATNTNVAAVNSKTTATTQAASATDSLTLATGDLSTVANGVTSAIANTTTAQQSFVDGLGNVYNSYQALVDAIRNNPLLAGPAVSQSGSGVSGSGPSAAPGQAFKDALGNVYSSYADLQAAIAKNPLLAGAAQSSGPLQNITPASGGTNQTFTVGGRQVSMSEYLDSLGSSGGFSGGASAGTSPTGPGFGLPSSNLSNQSGAAIVVNLHYPQFNTQQQAQQVISQVVQQLRTSAGLKL